MTKKLIFVLGMHRSGTSAIARSLRVLGVDLGSKMAPPAEDNKKGFWEDSDFCSLNMEMLKAVGCDWDSLHPVSGEDVKELVQNGFLDRASSLLQEKLRGKDIFGFKDPRMARLLPFWKKVFLKERYEVGYVIAFRHPLSVAKSLEKRNGILPVKTYYLWLGHVLESLKVSCEAQSVLVNYDDLMQSPEVALKRMADTFGTIIDSEDLEIFRTKFLDHELRHSIYRSEDFSINPSCPQLVKEVYEVLLELTSKQKPINKDELRRKIACWINEFNRYTLLFLLIDEQERQKIGLGQELIEGKHKLEVLNQTIEDRDKQLVVLNQVVEDRDKQLEVLNQVAEDRDKKLKELKQILKERDDLLVEIKRITESISWRLTRPFRFLARFLRYGLIDNDKEKLLLRLRFYYHAFPLPNTVRKRFNTVLPVFLRSFEKGQAGTVSEISKPFLAQRNTGESDYFIWGVIDWHFRYQRPQQLAKAFAKQGKRVFYVSSTIQNNDSAGFECETIGSSGRIFQIKLFAEGASSIYSGAPGLQTIEQLRKSIGQVLCWTGSNKVISIVNHPYWYEIATVMPNSKLVYDCMDHHEGFGNNAESLLQLERNLISEADLTVTSSSWLDDSVKDHVRRSVLIRNACDYPHFSKTPDSYYQDSKGRKVLGYFGAIAEWFDLELVKRVAEHHRDCHILLIGADTVNAHKKLSRYSNVTFLGEIPYERLPFYLYGFDICLLPFKVIPLTLATNPVKVYEYLSAGKPVIAVDLPEMKQFGHLVHTASSHEDYVVAVEQLLSRQESDVAIQKRKEYACEQTWELRAESFINNAESLSADPVISIIIVTYNNLDLTKECLTSVEKYTEYENLEIIVVDNASHDGTTEYLAEWVENAASRKLVLNEDNRGFAAANNQGLAIANGQFLVLLNNDTYVTPGWVRTLYRHLRNDPTLGLIGPVTNNIGNEAKINISYDNMDEMLKCSRAYTSQNLGRVFPLKTAAFFCVMLPRSTYEKVGDLDEAFGRGFFEDDDYCRRVEKLGLRIVCAEDVFIHHHLSASFDKLKNTERQKLFEENKRIYEAKWGEWLPHTYR